MKETYVISILRVKDYKRDNCEPYWEYASYDNYAGSMSSGYPCFSSVLGQAEKYSSVEEAEEKFSKWWDDFASVCRNYRSKYDIKSLGIRKMIFSTKKKLEVK